MSVKIISKSLQQTEELAKKVAEQLCDGKVVLLVGDLGAGKTTFSKSLIKALGVNTMVTSPTFTLLNEYQGKFKINHFDMYRLENEDEAIDVGFDEILNSDKGVSIVEWPEKVKGILPKDCVKIQISIIDENTREFCVEGL